MICNFFPVRLAPEETSMKLTGFEHNAVTCVGMRTDIPVLIFMLMAITFDHYKTKYNYAKFLFN